MNTLALKTIIHNMDKNKTYVCVYGDKKEAGSVYSDNVFIIDHNGIHINKNLNSDKTAVIIPVENIDYSKLHKISLSSDLYNGNYLDLDIMKLAGYNDEIIDTILTIDKTGVLPTGRLDGCWIFKDSYNKRSAWTYIENERSELRNLTLDEDGEIIIGLPLMTVINGKVAPVVYNPDEDIKYFLDTVIPGDMKFVCRVTSNNKKEIANQIKYTD